MAKMEVLRLTPTQRGEIHVYLRSRNLPASVAQRMRIVLSLDEGASYRDIEEKLGTPASTISRWKRRFQEDGLLGLATIHLRDSRHRNSPRRCGRGCWSGPGKRRPMALRIGRCGKWRR